MGGADFVLALLARNLPLDGRMIGQLAVPVPPQLRAILISGDCVIHPSYAAETRGQCTIERRDLGCIVETVLWIRIGFLIRVRKSQYASIALVGLARRIYSCAFFSLQRAWRAL